MRLINILSISVQPSLQYTSASNWRPVFRIYGCNLHLFRLCSFTLSIYFFTFFLLGLIYLVLKHLVDKYNIYFAYGPSKIKKSIHTSAINFVLVSVVILQCTLLFYTILRQGMKSPLTLYSIALLTLTAIFLVSNLVLRWFTDLSPIKYRVC